LFLSYTTVIVVAGVFCGTALSRKYRVHPLDDDIGFVVVAAAAAAAAEAAAVVPVVVANNIVAVFAVVPPLVFAAPGDVVVLPVVGAAAAVTEEVFAANHLDPPLLDAAVEVLRPSFVDSIDVSSAVYSFPVLVYDHNFVLRADPCSYERDYIDFERAVVDFFDSAAVR